jgi:hypothetical protein
MKKKLTKSQREHLNSLFVENGLTTDDVFMSPQFAIITRTGIEKIQARHGVVVTFEVVSDNPGFVVIKAKATHVDPNTKNVLKVETYGEASPQNNRTKYPFAMAEKRALSRAVLKVVGLYAHAGVISEDEHHGVEDGDR